MRDGQRRGSLQSRRALDEGRTGQGAGRRSRALARPASLIAARVAPALLAALAAVAAADTPSLPSPLNAPALPAGGDALRGLPSTPVSTPAGPVPPDTEATPVAKCSRLW